MTEFPSSQASGNAHLLGTLVQVDPRTVWANEATQFTPWLAENLPILNQALGIDIELTGTEIAVGAFSVDIAGRETSTGHNVIIENQLAPTDHSHLGQLLTYAAGIDARIIVWISPNVRDEHRQAVDWLNRQTPETISFFAVQLELLRIDSSLPAPRFVVVAEPSEFQREVASEALQKRTPRELAYHRFFSALINRMNELSPGFTNVKSVGYFNWITLGSGTTGFGLNVQIAKANLFRVEIYIGTGDMAKNRSALSYLREREADLSTRLGVQLVWEQLPKDCRIFSAFNTPVDPENPPEGAIDWGASMAVKFREVFGPILRELRPQLDSLGSPSTGATA